MHDIVGKLPYSIAKVFFFSLYISLTGDCNSFATYHNVEKEMATQ